jgi:hypothetical protein
MQHIVGIKSGCHGINRYAQIAVSGNRPLMAAAAVLQCL